MWQYYYAALQENYLYILLYVVLQIPLVIFSWDYSFLVFVGDVFIWTILTILLWQIFLIGLMVIVILNKLFIKNRLILIEKEIHEFQRSNYMMMRERNKK